MPAAAGLTKEDFCARLVKAGESSLAKCTADDKNTVTFLNFKRDFDATKDDCEKALKLPHADFHGDVAASCISALEKVKSGNVTFATVSQVPECEGVLSGTVSEGQAATNDEECSAGFTLSEGKCQKPLAENHECVAGGGHPFGKPADHNPCSAGLVCSHAGQYGEDGQGPPAHCIKARELGGNCNAKLEDCPDGSTCYQGKCRAKAALDGECMSSSDCLVPNFCLISGGVFGKCSAKLAAGTACRDGADCVSGECRGNKCFAFCGSD